jgi:hypothetical protein
MALVVVAVLIELFAVQRTSPIRVGGAAWALVAVVPGVALTHPSVIVAALVLSCPFVLARLISDVRMRRETRPWWRVGLAATYLLGTAIAFMVVHPPLNSAPWEPTQSDKEAIGAIVTVSPGSALVSWGLFGLAIAGFAVVARRPMRTWPVALMFAIGAAVYFASAAVETALARDLLSGVWYRDTERVSAVFVVAAFPLVLAGGLACVTGVRVLLDRAALFRAPIREMVAVTAVVLVVALVSQRGPLPQAQEWLHQSFGNEAQQRLLSDDERALMNDVAAQVPADGVVVGNPRTGASLTPAFASRATLAPHIFGIRTADEQYLLDHWDEAGTDPAVCPIIESLDAYWALDFGSADVLGGSDQVLHGTDSLAGGDAAGVRQIARVGDAALYEATICGSPRP